MQRNKTMRTGHFIRGMQACMVLLLVCLMGVFSCSNAYAYTEKDKEDPLYWRYFDEDGNRLSDKKEEVRGEEGFSSEAMLESIDVTDGTIYSPYTPGNNISAHNFTTRNGSVAHGIDVSKWNGKVDFKKVKDSGVDYVWIRCGVRYSGSGDMDEDPYFKTNFENAKAAGLKVGVYMFSQAINKAEGVEEAEFTLDIIGDRLSEMDLPVVLDVEYVSGKGRLKDANLSVKAQTNVILAFAKRIQEAGGNVAAYASYSFVKKGSDQKFDPVTLADQKVGLWLARYNTTAGYSEADYIAWQYDSGGNVPGCTGGDAGGADLNFMYEDSLAKLYMSESDCTFLDVSVPTKVKASSTASKITLSWAKQDDVYGYVILKKAKQDSDWTRAAMIWNPETVSYVDKNVSKDITYQYKVSSILAKDGLTRSTYSAEVYSMLKPAALYATLAGQTSSADSRQSVSVTWDPVPNASYYLLYRKVDDGEYERIYKGTEDIYYDTDLEIGATYTYRVRAAFEMPDGTKVYSTYSKVMEYKAGLAKPLMKTLVSESANSITVTWTSVPNVKGYRVYRKVAGGSYGGYIAIVKENYDGTIPSYTDDTAETGVQYYYKVRAYMKSDKYGTVFSEYAKPLSGYSMPPMVKALSLTSVRYDRLKLTWELVEGVDGYMIQQFEADGTRSNVADVAPDEDSYTLKGLTSGTQYQFAVCGYILDEDAYVFGETDSKGLKCKPVPTMPTGKFASSTKGKVNITWNKIAGATGYLIYYKTSEDGERKVKARPMAADKRNVEVSGKSGTTCYYAVRAYRKVGDKTVYSKYEWVPVEVE